MTERWIRRKGGRIYHLGADEWGSKIVCQPKTIYSSGWSYIETRPAKDRMCEQCAAIVKKREMGQTQ